MSRTDVHRPARFVPEGEPRGHNYKWRSRREESRLLNRRLRRDRGFRVEPESWVLQSPKSWNDERLWYKV